MEHNNDIPPAGTALPRDHDLAIRDGKLWVTANNYLYRYDLADNGKTSNRTTLLTDRNKAWNPFGTFVLEWGPDGLLYMSVGNHAINLQGPDGTLGGRGNSGMVMRMNPDGTKMQRLVTGLRVPYSYEYDPFGQLWVLLLWDGVVVVPVLGVVVDPEFVVVPELELAAFAIAAPPPAMIPTAPKVTRAIRSRFMAFTSFRRLVFVQAKTPRLRRA